MEMERALTGVRLGCTAECDPSGWNALNFGVPVAPAALARALTVRDVTTAGRVVPVAPAGAPTSTGLGAGQPLKLEDAGFNRAPPNPTGPLRRAPSLPLRRRAPCLSHA